MDNYETCCKEVKDREIYNNYIFKDINKNYYCNNDNNCEFKIVGLKNFKFSGGFNYLEKDGVVKSVYIKDVIYSNPATIVMWSDGTKTVSKVHGEDGYNPEVGLVLCVLKKLQGSTHIRDLLHTWVPENAYTDKFVSINTSEARKREKE